MSPIQPSLIANDQGMSVALPGDKDHYTSVQENKNVDRLNRIIVHANRGSGPRYTYMGSNLAGVDCNHTRPSLWKKRMILGIYIYIKVRAIIETDLRNKLRQFIFCTIKALSFITKTEFFLRFLLQSYLLHKGLDDMYIIVSGQQYLSFSFTGSQLKSSKWA